MNTPQDPRTERTLAAIETAFVDLMQMHDFEDITAQAIIQRANINRNTFYKYYDGKQGLANKLAGNLKREYKQMIAVYFSDDFQKLIHNISPMMFAKRRLILTLWRINTRKLHVYADMENLIKQGFIKYAQTQQTERDWDFAAEMFAKLLLNSARYFWERDQQIPIKQVFADWDAMLNIAKR